MADFGTYGTIVFIFLSGFISQKLFLNQQRKPSAIRASIIVFVSVCILFSGLISVLILPQIHWALYGALLLALISKYYGKRKESVSPIDRKPTRKNSLSSLRW
jgi:sugar phosphate permease